MTTRYNGNEERGDKSVPDNLPPTKPSRGEAGMKTDHDKETKEEKLAKQQEISNNEAKSPKQPIARLRLASGTAENLSSSRQSIEMATKLRLASGVAAENVKEQPKSSKDRQLRLASGSNLHAPLLAKAAGVKPTTESEQSQLATKKNPLEASFRSFWAILNGIPREMDATDERLFQSFIHDDFCTEYYDQGKKQQHGKNEWKQIVFQEMLRNGAQCHILLLDPCIVPNKPFEYKLQFVYNSISDRNQHAIGTITEDEQFIRSEPFDKKRYRELTRACLMPRFMEYATMINGVAREFGAPENAIFESSFHDECNIVHGDDILAKTEWKQTVVDMIQKGREAEVSNVKWIDDNHLEFKIRFTSNAQLHLLQHSIATFKDGKIFHIEPFQDITHLEILRDSFQEVWSEFFSILCVTPVPRQFTGAMDEIFDRLYHDDFHMIYGGTPTTRYGY